jgi:hypothetical protein
MRSSELNGQYEVLNPWAEADPIPLRGISPRLTDLTGKKIGLFYNFKQAAKPILNVVEVKLKERFPTSEIHWYAGHPYSIIENETETKAEFEEWAKEVDAVVTAVGD